MNREASTRDEESPRACPCKWTVGISPRGEGVSPSPSAPPPMAILPRSAGSGLSLILRIRRLQLAPDDVPAPEHRPLNYHSQGATLTVHFLHKILTPHLRPTPIAVALATPVTGITGDGRATPAPRAPSTPFGYPADARHPVCRDSRPDPHHSQKSQYQRLFSVFQPISKISKHI
jgi:hypothetical protein